jgi:hypothetical protein
VATKSQHPKSPAKVQLFRVLTFRFLPFPLPFAEFFRFLLAAPQIFCECVIFDLKCGKIAETDNFTSPTLANIKYLYYLCSAI